MDMCFVKNEAPFFSVIIPSYNAGKYILLTRASVFEQSFSGYEIIIIDDGSTDNTQDVLVAIRDSRVRVITQKNAGAAAARNRGICEAMGKF